MPKVKKVTKAEKVMKAKYQLLSSAYFPPGYFRERKRTRDVRQRYKVDINRIFPNQHLFGGSMFRSMVIIGESLA